MPLVNSYGVKIGDLVFFKVYTYKIAPNWQKFYSDQSTILENQIFPDEKIYARRVIKITHDGVYVRLNRKNYFLQNNSFKILN